MGDGRRSYAVMAAVGALAGSVTFVFFMTSGPFPRGIGAIFGLLVAPQIVRRSAYPVLKVLAVGAVSAVAYVVAVLVVQRIPNNDRALGWIVAFGAAGSVGAGLIGLGLLAILGRRRALGVVGPMIAAGTMAGFVFGGLVGILPGDHFWAPLKFCLGFIIWQSSVAAPLGRLLRDAKTTLPEL